MTKSNGRVMLTGQAGSGKEVAARYIHANSNRASAPFITVNSASIEPERMEEVLFGRESPERGVEQGLLEQAHGGVIYFDEVADMPLGTQSKILRVLVDQQFTRVGGNDKVRVDLRVISSTNRDLEAAIRAETFRQELYHRLNVVPIRCRRWRTGARISPNWRATSSTSSTATQGLAIRALGRRCAAPCCRRWSGRATCASSRT